MLSGGPWRIRTDIRVSDAGSLAAVPITGSVEGSRVHCPRRPARHNGPEHEGLVNVEEEDKEFFILVLGVLAAIILVVSWWYTTGGTATPAAQLPTPATATEQGDTDDHGDDDADGEPHDDADDDPHDDADGDHDDDDPEPGEEDTDQGDDAGATDDNASAPDSSDSGDASAAPLPPSVFDAIAANGDLSVVQDLLRDNGLDQVLANDGPYTVFAPSNDAISSAAASDTTASVLENDIETVLTYHVVAGSYTLDELTEIARGGRSTELVTLQGEPIELTFDADNLLINGSAAVDPDSIETDNGRVHTLDNVLIPPVAALNTLVGLDPILFATGSADIQEESFATLDQFIEVLNASNVVVTIEGHTDSSGDAILNQNLSQSRARSVLNYLVANGVDESRLSAQGFGPDRPVADNDTEEGRALNRRIEFRLG